MPRRIRLSRARGWRLPANAVVVARPTRWGNPFAIGDPGVPDRATAVRRHRELLARDALLRARARASLAGRDLACWCPLDEPCHADALLAVANDTDCDAIDAPA